MTSSRSSRRARLVRGARSATVDMRAATAREPASVCVEDLRANCRQSPRIDAERPDPARRALQEVVVARDEEQMPPIGKIRAESQTFDLLGKRLTRQVEARVQEVEERALPHRH